MKRLLILILFCSPLTSISGQVQNAVFTHNFKSKQAQSIIITKITEYCQDVLKYSVSEDNNKVILGNIKDFYATRSSNEKRIYSASLIMKYSFDGNTVLFDIHIPSVEETIIICDRTQKETTNIFTYESMQNIVGGKLNSITNNIVNQIRNYISKGEKANPLKFNTPDWVKLKYIPEDDYVSYYSIIKSDQNLSRSELYLIAENFFTYAYRSGKAVIETRDPERCIITGKGTYANIKRAHNSFLGYTDTYSLPHILTIECRDGRIRATVTIQHFDINRAGSKYVKSEVFSENVTSFKPFGNVYGEAIIISAEKKIKEEFQDLKKAIEEGNSIVQTLDNW